MEKMDDQFYDKTGILLLDETTFANLCESLFIDESIPEVGIQQRYAYKGHVFIINHEDDSYYLEIIN